MASERIEAWDTSLVFLRNQDKYFDLRSIGKYCGLQTLVLENSGLETLFHIHLCRELKHIFLANNQLLHDLNSINRMSHIYILDLLNCPQLDISALYLLNQTSVVYLNIGGDKNYVARLADEVQNAFIHTHQPYYFEPEYYVAQLPAQGACACHLLYNHDSQKDCLQQFSYYHVRLFLVRILYKISALNYKIITPKEKTLAMTYFQLNRASSDRIRYYIELSEVTAATYCSRSGNVNYEQHFQQSQHLLQVLSVQQCKFPHCVTCAGLNAINYISTIQFASVDKLDFRVITMLLLYLTDLIRYFTIDMFEKELNRRFQVEGTRIEAQYLQYLPNINHITPYLLCEILTVNHLVVHKQSVSPRLFVNVATAILRNDMMRSYVLHKLLYGDDPSKYKQNFVRFVAQVRSLNQLYDGLLAQLAQLLKCVRLAPKAKQLDFEQQLSSSPFVAIENEFIKQNELALNSVAYFHRILSQKYRLLTEKSGPTTNSLSVSEIDVFNQMYWYDGDAEDNVLNKGNQAPGGRSVVDVLDVQAGSVPDDVFGEDN